MKVYWLVEVWSLQVLKMLVGSLQVWMKEVLCCWCLNLEM